MHIDAVARGSARQLSAALPCRIAARARIRACAVLVGLTLLVGTCPTPTRADGLVAEVYDIGVFTPVVFSWPSQIAFFDDYEIVTEVQHHRIVYRRAGRDESWIKSPLQLLRPHATAQGADGIYYTCDTGHGSIISFEDPAQEEPTRRAHMINGMVTADIHDILLDEQSGYLYALGGNGTLFRFRSFGQDEDHKILSLPGGSYARSLAWMDGKLHIVNSNHGQVICIDDWDSKKYHVYVSPKKTNSWAEGSWTRTGLILNDVVYWEGWYYGSNYFVESMAPSPEEHVNRLIRWRSWGDFEAGAWEDLSELLPPQLVAYNFAVHGDRLFLTTFAPEQEVSFDDVYVLRQR